MVAEIYWAMAGDGSVLPESGGLLDQDRLLTFDLQTYGWLRAIAEGLIDKDERSLEKGKANIARLSGL